MTDSTVQTPGPDASAQPSTVLTPDAAKTPSGAGTPSLREDTSIQSVLQAELKTIRADEAKAAETAKAEEAKQKGEQPAATEKDSKTPAEGSKRDGTGKFTKTEAAPVANADNAQDGKDGTGQPEKAATGQDAQERARQSEGRDHHQPPAKFLPKAKEVWANVPHAVKSEISRITQEHDTELSKYRANHEAYETIREFDERARHGGTSLRNALIQYTGMEDLLRRDPAAGIATLLRGLGMTPQQYAEHVIKNPNAHAFRPQVQQPQAPQPNAEVQALRNEIATMRQDQVARDFIEPFRAENPRYDELQDDIALFLKSGKIPASLTPLERLAAAYDMAVRVNPTSSVVTSQAAEARPADARVPSDAGTKSVRGAPPDGSDTSIPEPNSNIRDLIRKEMQRMVA